MSVPFLPVAQYLRMSTDLQQYSMANQAEAIKNYCRDHNLVVVKTYKDAGRSGIAIKDRPSLIQLLRDVVNNPVFKAIVVYDVSRWGRFQDTDEAAHYEFICKSSGVPVYYCAEMFGTEASVGNTILKGLKRVMAAEYSRELGERCYRGQRRLVEAGFKCGGTAPYGLRRLLVSRTGAPKQFLRDGERKSLQDERVILVQGTDEEVETVRTIFRWFVYEHWDMKRIARELNARHVPFPPGTVWNRDNISNLLKNPKYYGCNVWGRTTQRLKRKKGKLSETAWVVKENAIPSIIDRRLFEEAQEVRSERYWSNERLLKGLQQVLSEEGAITQEILERRKNGPRYGAIARHFGTLQNALTLIGYRYVKNYEDARVKGYSTQRIHRHIVRELQKLFPNRVSIHCHSWSPRLHLRVDDSINVSIHICPAVQTRKRVVWRLVPRLSEVDNVTLCCLMDLTNECIQRMCLTTDLRVGKVRVMLRGDEDLLYNAVPVNRLKDFMRCLKRLLAATATRQRFDNPMKNSAHSGNSRVRSFRVSESSSI